MAGKVEEKFLLGHELILFFYETKVMKWSHVVHYSFINLTLPILLRFLHFYYFFIVTKRFCFFKAVFDQLYHLFYINMFLFSFC